MNEGFAIHPGIIQAAELQILRDESDRLQREFGSTCVRHLRSKSPLFHDLASDPRIRRLIPSELVPVRSILFDKTPEENWPVAWHQDLTIALRERHELDGYGPWSVKDGVVHVQPPIRFLEGMTTVRIHLDDTPAENGALRVVPGSHAFGKLGAGEIRSRSSTGAVTCECRAGDVLLMSPLILHASSRSEKPARRRIVHFEFGSPEALDSRLGFHEI